MNIKENKDGTYSVESTSRKGKWYDVDLKKPWCDCPAYKFRHMKSKSPCKHIKAAQEFAEKRQQKTLATEQKKADKAVEWIEAQGGEVDSLELIEKFGEESVDALIERGELLESRGRIKILK